MVTSGGIGYNILIVVSEHKTSSLSEIMKCHRGCFFRRVILRSNSSSMEKQSITDYNQAMSAKADISRDAIEMYRFSGKMEYRR